MQFGGRTIPGEGRGMTVTLPGILVVLVEIEAIAADPDRMVVVGSGFVFAAGFGRMAGTGHLGGAT